MFLTQAQYIFIHDAIKHKLESLGYGLTSSANDNDDDDDDDTASLSKLQPASVYCTNKIPTLHVSIKLTSLEASAECRRI